MAREKIIFSWSGGKDSARAFYELCKADSHEIYALLTTVTEDYNRISMHGVRSSLLDLQAASLSLSLEKVYIPKDSSNEDYETRMKEKLMFCKTMDVLAVAFGDIFLEDLRKYRENNLASIGMKVVFPIWKNDTDELAR